MTDSTTDRARWSEEASAERPIWPDAHRPVADRVEALVGAMTLEGKLAQLVGLWVGAQASGDGVAPHQSDMAERPLDWDDVILNGLGQLTRPFGTSPVAPAAGARSLAASQAQIVAAGRFGIPRWCTRDA